MNKHPDSVSGHVYLNMQLSDYLYTQVHDSSLQSLGPGVPGIQN